MDRDLPEGVDDADAPAGREPITDGAASDQNAAVEGSPDLVDDTSATEAGLLTDAAAPPDDPVAGERVRRNADPDLSADRGEEP
ncbi:hypothetical protein [Microbacterium sp. NPDC055357]